MTENKKGMELLSDGEVLDLIYCKLADIIDEGMLTDGITTHGEWYILEADGSFDELRGRVTLAKELYKYLVDLEENNND
jgi:hypothetical protein